MKKEKFDKITTLYYSDLEGPLKDQILILQRYIDEYGERGEVYLREDEEYTYDGSERYNLAVCIRRLETDEEYAARLEKEAKLRAFEEERERKHLLYLQQKYGGKNGSAE